MQPDPVKLFDEAEFWNEVREVEAAGWHSFESVVAKVEAVIHGSVTGEFGPDSTTPPEPPR